MWERGSLNWAQAMLQWFIRFPEFTELTESSAAYLFLPSATKLRMLCFYMRVSVHTGGGHLPQCMLGYHHPLEQTLPWSRPPREQTPLEQTPPSPGADNPSWEKTPPGADTPLGADITNPVSRKPLGPKHSPRRDGHFCGRYAFYWNAFLFNLFNCRNLCDCRELISKSE